MSSAHATDCQWQLSLLLESTRTRLATEHSANANLNIVKGGEEKEVVGVVSFHLETNGTDVIGCKLAFEGHHAPSNLPAKGDLMFPKEMGCGKLK